MNHYDIVQRWHTKDLVNIVSAVSNKQFDIVRELIEQPINNSSFYFIIKYLIRNNAPLDILKSTIDKLTDDKQETLNKLILMSRISDDAMLFILDAGANPNAMYCGESIFIRILTNKFSPSQTLLLLDHGANPNSKASDGLYALDLCRLDVQFHLMRYGATDALTQYGAIDVNNHSGVYIKRVLIVCDMMLHIDDGVPSDWIREIKGCLY